MKIFRLFTFLLVSVLVFGCEKAKDNTEDNVNDESLVAVQNAMIEPIQKALPIAIDELTTLIGVDKDRNIINYQYEVKNTSEHTLLLPSTLDTIRQALFKAYCENNEEMQQLKTAFPDGANYHYFIDNKEIVVVELTPADCRIK
ncbi:hypothetical protein [Gilliamella sp. A7]|uniref:hypothetical protein n=1 Tax=Gilliamella sp. A7 TaxID=1970465 RepID=UPI000A347C34|nr:hypothetical protein [Gilliamella sp. A7]OTQ59570.1 hypothetical protein B6D18_03505 [Gilliamella sp. A7]